jgi:DNA-directed RNA polymerase subunit N (RpoN/RPB10)
VSTTTAIRCHGDAAHPGCGRPVAMSWSGELHALKRAEILSIDLDGRASVRCLECGSVTTTRGMTPATR